MIAYNPKDWFSFIFRFHKADTFRKLVPAMLTVALYSTGIAWLEIKYWQTTDQTHLKNLGVVHSLLGFVISLLLVFRTNTAYERWWEGRKLWGDLVNNSRSLALKLKAIHIPKSEKKIFAENIAAFAAALRTHLQHGDHATKHVPNEIAAKINEQLIKVCSSAKLRGDALVLFAREFHAFSDICGACERIKNTPIPYSYSAFIKKFVFFYAMTMPFGFAFTLGFYMVPVVVFIFYALASLELIAEEIEDPFGFDPNDLPLAKLIVTIEKNVKEILA